MNRFATLLPMLLTFVVCASLRAQPTTINTFPYEPSESEQASDFLANYGSGPTASGSTWTNGTLSSPRRGTGGTGVQAWAVLPSSSYASSTTTWLHSPIFDFSSDSGLELKFDLWVDTEGAADGLKLQVSSDGGSTWDDVTTQSVAYNEDASLLVSLFGSSSSECWGGSSLGGATAVTCSLNLNPWFTESDVRFRWCFVSNAKGNDDGVVIDSIRVVPVIGTVGYSSGYVAVPQGSAVLVEITKTGGSAFSSGMTVAFGGSGLTATGLNVGSADVCEMTLYADRTADAGAHMFHIVLSSGILVCEGVVDVFYPQQLISNRQGGSVQEPPMNGSVGSNGVYLHNGEFRHDLPIILIPGRMLPLYVGLTYRSRFDSIGAVGAGWSVSFDNRLTYDSVADEIRLFSGDGRIDDFELQSGGTAGEGPYVKAGFFLHIERDDNGTPDIATDDSYTAAFADGSLARYEAVNDDVANQQVFRQTSFADRNGNEIIYEYNSAGQLGRMLGDMYDAGISTETYALDFTYNDHGRLSKITDYADFTAQQAVIGSSYTGNREWEFIYNGSAQLIEIKLPKTENYYSETKGANYRTRFQCTYDSSDNLLEVIDAQQANETTPIGWLRNHYTSDKVDYQDIGRSSTGDTTHRHHIVYASGTDVSVVDAEKHRSQYLLNTDGTLDEVRRYTGTWNANATVLNSTPVHSGDPSYFSTQYEYDSQFNLKRVQYPAGNEEQIAYDVANTSQLSRGNVLLHAKLPGSMASPGLPGAQQNGLLWTYTYEAGSNRMATAVDSRAYDLPAGYQVATHATSTPPTRDDSALYKVEWTYHSTTGNLIKVEMPQITAAQSPSSPAVGDQYIMEFVYNAYGQLVQQADTSTYPTGAVATGVVYDFEYGTAGFNSGYLVKSVTDPAGLAEEVEFSYDSLGNASTVTAINGAVWTSFRNQLGDLVKTLSPTISSLGGIQYEVFFNWDRHGNLTRREIKDPVLDSSGQPTSQLRSIVTEWQHDILGNVVSTTEDVTETSTRTYTQTYDLMFRPIEQHSPCGTKVAQTYDELNRPYVTYSGMLISDAYANALATTKVDYDANGNVASVTDPRSNVRVRTYDACDRLRTMEDARTPLSTIYSFTYAHGASPREVKIEGDPDGTGTARTVLAHHMAWMDNAGRTYRVASKAVASNGTTALSYPTGTTGTNDMTGWSVSTTHLLPDGRLWNMVSDLLSGTTPSSSTPLWSMEYDAAGRITKMTDVAGNKVRRVYSSGMMTEEFTDSIDTGTQVIQTSRNAYTYDELDRVLTLQECTQVPVEFTWNALGDMARKESPSPTTSTYITRFDYDHAGRLTKESVSANDLWSLTTNPTLSTNSSQTSEILYEYDDDDNLTRTIDNGGNQTLFHYDLMRRMVQVEFANGGKTTAGSSHTLTAKNATYFQTPGGFDAGGNLVTMLDEAGNIITRTYSSENELLTMAITKATGSLIEGLQGASYSYDGLGRMLTVTSDQYAAPSHTRTMTWNSLSRAQSWTEQVGSGLINDISRGIDESGRVYRTEQFSAPATDIVWKHDALGRVNRYTVSQGTSNFDGGWSHQGSGQSLTARSIGSNEDVNIERDQRGKIVQISYARRDPQATFQRVRHRYLYDDDTGLPTGMVNLDRPVLEGEEGRIGKQLGTPIGAGLYYGNRTLYDGLGRITGVANEVGMSATTTTGSSWSATQDTHAVAYSFDSVGLPTEIGVFLGEEFPSQVGTGYLTMPHTSQSGSSTNPVAVGQGSRLVPTAIGDVALAKTSDDQLRTSNDKMNEYYYDIEGRRVRTVRISDSELVDKRCFDATGFVYQHDVPQSQLVSVDFASQQLTGVSFSTSALRFDGGGLDFTQGTGLATIQFPGAIGQSANGGIGGGFVSYHDFLLDRRSGQLANLHFESYAHALSFRLEVADSALTLYSQLDPSQAQVQQATASWPGGLGVTALGIRVTLSGNDVTVAVYSSGSLLFSHTHQGTAEWSPDLLSWEADAGASRLYMYRGYMELDFSVVPLTTIELTPEERVLNSLCSSGVPVTSTSASAMQDQLVRYQILMEQAIELKLQGKLKPSSTGCNSSNRLLDLLAELEQALWRGFAAEAALKYGRNATNEHLSVGQSQVQGSVSTQDVEPLLNANNTQFLFAPRIELDPMVLAEVNQPLVIPFFGRLPHTKDVQFEASGPNGTGIPATMSVTIVNTVNRSFQGLEYDNPQANNFLEITAFHHYGHMEYVGEISWTPTNQDIGQDFWIHVRFKVDSITTISSLPFAEAKCLIRVLPSSITVPILEVSSDDTGYTPLFFNAHLMHHPFAYAHVNDEFYTTYSTEIYSLWCPYYASTLAMNFGAHSPGDPITGWSVSGISGGGASSVDANGHLEWLNPAPGLYQMQVSATNSVGQGTLIVNLRIVQPSRAWCIRPDHTTTVDYAWNEGALWSNLEVHQTWVVWGGDYEDAGYKTYEYLGSTRLRAFASNASFDFAGSFFRIEMQQGSSPSPWGPVIGFYLQHHKSGGPLPVMPDLRILPAQRLALHHQYEEWQQEMRDEIEFAREQFERGVGPAADELSKLMNVAHAELMADLHDKLDERKRRIAVIEGAAFKIADIWDIVVPGENIDDSDREAMAWYYESRWRGDAFNTGQVAGGLAYVAAWSLATGGLGSEAALAFVATRSFASYAAAGTGSFAFSATYQVYSTGQIDPAQLAIDTATGVAFMGMFNGGTKVLRWLRGRGGSGCGPTIYVIGRQVDTALARNWPGHRILDLPPGEWSMALNRRWIQGIIERRASVYIGSPQTRANLWNPKRGEPTVFAQEIEQLKHAGYTQQGDWLIPPQG